MCTPAHEHEHEHAGADHGGAEHHIAKVSGSKHAFAVSSGMAALDIICKLISPGDHVIAGNDLYGGTNRLLTYLGTNGGIKVHHVDTTVTESLRAPLESGARVSLVLLETPTNPLLQIADIIEIAKLVRATQPHALIAVDNTMMSPYMMRPLELGVDIVYDSATKYLSGHHDLMAGVITCNRDDVAKRIAFAINSVGNGLPPFDSFLLLRGMKTLALRFDRMQATAMSVATYLHALGFKVNYPGLPGHPGKEVHDKMARGAGAVLSFETGDTVLSERIVGATRLWGISVSFGCVNSLISMPCLMSYVLLPGSGVECILTRWRLQARVDRSKGPSRAQLARGPHSPLRRDRRPGRPSRGPRGRLARGRRRPRRRRDCLKAQARACGAYRLGRDHRSRRRSFKPRACVSDSRQARRLGTRQGHPLWRARRRAWHHRHRRLSRLAQLLHGRQARGRALVACSA